MKLIKWKLCIFGISLLLSCKPGFCVENITSTPAQNIKAQYDENRLRQVASDLRWKKLLHYNQFFPWSGTSGEVDGDGFYFSPKGRVDPLSELKATLSAFEVNQKVGKLNQPAICAFPERLRFLKEQLQIQITAPAKGDCPEYDHFISKMESKTVEIVFSSAYSSNPGSMFGHTLFKFVKGNKSDLLDQGVSFAATVQANNEGGLLYVLYGLFGGYSGDFSFQPYYQKVNEYINSESRDLWEYRLNLSPAETHSLINNLWEIESNSWFDYYFINKNCSYQLLAALEVVKPDWDLSSGWFFVVPAETIKRVSKIPGAITQVRFRPSLKRKLEEGIELLPIKEKVEFKRLINRDVDPDQIDSKDVLSAAIQYVQYFRAEKEGSFDESLREFWKKLLARQNILSQGILVNASATVSPAIALKSPVGNPAPNSGQASAYEQLPQDPPELGHGPFRLSLSQGVFQRGGLDGGGFEEFHIKPAYHDLLNDDRGYLPFSEINFPNLTLRYYPNTAVLNLETLQLVSMTSLSPFSFLEKRASWKVDIKIETPKDLACTNCHVFHSEMGWGATLNLFSPKSLLYGLIGGYLDVGAGLGSFYRFGPSAELGVLTNPFKPYKLRLRVLAYSDIFQPDRPPAFGTLELSQSLSFLPHWEVRLAALSVQGLGSLNYRFSSYSEGKISVNYYF